MDELLVRLLERLEEVGREHEEIYDTEVRQKMGDAVFAGFIRPKPDYKLPTDFGLYAPQGNAAVRDAIEEYISAANAQAEALGLRRFHDRLAAFQNVAVETPDERNHYDDFFGSCSPDAFDESGTLIND